jgi:hypothetical protein
MRTLPFVAFLLLIGTPLAAQAPGEEAPVTVVVPLDQARTLDRVSSAFLQAGLELSSAPAFGHVVGFGLTRDSSEFEVVARVEGRGATSQVTLSATPHRKTTDPKLLRARLESLAAAISGGA